MDKKPESAYVISSLFLLSFFLFNLWRHKIVIKMWSQASLLLIFIWPTIILHNFEQFQILLWSITTTCLLHWSNIQYVFKSVVFHYLITTGLVSGFNIRSHLYIVIQQLFLALEPMWSHVQIFCLKGFKVKIWRLTVI